MREMAQIIHSEPNHKGFARAASHLRNLIESGQRPFTEIRIDHPKELNDLIQTVHFESADDGLEQNPFTLYQFDIRMLGNSFRRFAG